jgi:hypothetical protein
MYGTMVRLLWLACVARQVLSYVLNKPAGAQFATPLLHVAAAATLSCYSFTRAPEPVGSERKAK